MADTAEHPWVRRCRPDGRPRVFAHRGGAALNPENTLPAFEHAVALGADGIELDVRLSRDGEAMVIHDPDLDRTTDLRGPVARATADELARADAGFHFRPDAGHPWRGRGAGVPRLRDVIVRFPALPFIVELKGRDAELARVAVEVVRAAGALDRVCFGGFSDDTLRAARRVGPDGCTSAATSEIRWALYRSYVGWPLGRQPYRAFQVPEALNGTTIVSPRFVRYAHRAGKLVQVWTVNTEPDMRRLVDWGVDGLITDRPDLALQVCAEAARPALP